MAAGGPAGFVALFALLCACSVSSLSIGRVSAEAAPAILPSSVSAEVAVCADCWTKDALGPVKEGESGRPQVICETVLAQGYWGQLKVTDEVNHPERLCVALELPAGQGVGSLKCEVEMEAVSGRLGKAASVGITYDYDQLNPRQPPKVTLEGKLCPSSLRDLPSAVSEEVLKGFGATKGPVENGVHTIANTASHIKDRLKNRFHHP